MNSEINKYLEKRYERWLDYAKYHCSKTGCDDQANDILNEVMVSVLEKDECKINCLYNSKKGQYRELDFFILKMIKLNVYSPTSPYQNKYKNVLFSEVELSRLNIPDEDYDEDDKPSRILSQFNQVREIFETLNLSDKAKRIFHHRFFMGLPFSEWNGNENKNDFYDTYNKIVDLIKMKLYKRSLL